MTTGWLCHELYMWHDTGSSAGLFPPGLSVQPGTHYENPETKRRFRNLVEVSGILDHLVIIKPRYATDAEISRVHTRAHIEKIRAMSEVSGGDASYLTPFGQGSFEIALLAAGGAIAAVDSVINGDVSNAYALVRPPGHHATPEAGMGFSLFGNVAVAIRHAQAMYGMKRVATVDWDVHHGNGTQAIFYHDPRVLTISLHQDNLFPPDSGGREENGAGDGKGYNINVPLPPGSGNGAYVAAFQRIVIPALHRYEPDLIIVPSGFDASGVDPLGRMMVSSEGYREMTRMLVKAANELCGDKLVMIHEGGYSESYVPYCGLAVLEEMAGVKTSIEDPWAPLMANWGQQALQPHQAAAIERAERLVDNLEGRGDQAT
jgi:acetoin utilization deacetylase AcuC-like enzyme